MPSQVIERWHAILASRELAELDDLIADDAVFHSPVVHSPQRGKEITVFYLTAAFHVLLDAQFRYVREVVGTHDAVLEFTAEIDGIHVNGVDMIHWNDAGRIDDFKVMVRPLKAVNMLHRQMGTMLEQLGGTSR
jgi:hypothetical protein